MTKRVGVIGGGQLAWMMGEAAQKLGLELVIQTPQTTDPAVAIATDTVLAAVADAQATADLATRCDVITFENEFVDLEALSKLAQQGIRFYPQLEALAPLLDKYHQRSYLKAIGLPGPEFTALEIDQNSALSTQHSALSAPSSSFPIPFPLVLKTRRHGYDGQGTFILKNQAELKSLPPKLQHIPLIAEEFIPFERELAIMAARSLSGEIVTYPVVETQQANQVCRRVLVTGEFSTEVTQQAEAIARTLLNNLKVVGIFGIELFLTKDGRVLVNEIAPRTHNSGHFTLDACLTSQFEQQLRAVCGLPLGSPTMQCNGAVMVNLLGYESSEDSYDDKRQRLAQLFQTHVYWYGKTSRPDRKLGHVTTLLDAQLAPDRRQQALAAIEAIEAIWYPTSAV